MYLLDTDTCIYVIKHRPPQVRARLSGVPLGEVAVSAATVAELCSGVSRSARPESNRQALATFLDFVVALDWPVAAGGVYGEIRGHLQQQGTPIGPMDLMIAAHARYLGAVLVTHNTREYSRVPGLMLEDWTDSQAS